MGNAIQTLPRLLVTALTVLASAVVLTWGISTLNSTRQAETGRWGFDPLSAAEQESARSTALASAALGNALAGARRQELLLVERHHEDKAIYQQAGPWPRRADVYVYNYDRDVLVHAIVDIAARKVDSLELLEGVQLPLTQRERAAAILLALNDPSSGNAIREQFHHATGTALERAEQLQVGAWVFNAAANPAAGGAELGGCGTRRCAQLILGVPDVATLPISPIVDLSTSRVLRAGN
jgi:Cu2+-containing amine oxidase